MHKKILWVYNMGYEMVLKLLYIYPHPFKLFTSTYKRLYDWYFYTVPLNFILPPNEPYYICCEECEYISRSDNIMGSRYCCHDSSLFSSDLGLIHYPLWLVVTDWWYDSYFTMLDVIYKTSNIR